jgi:uncharacterized protein (DUF1800 family)
VAANVPASPYVDTTVQNGTTYFYKVTALGSGGESARSAEASAMPTAPTPPPDPAALSAFRLLRQATWGPRPGDVERVAQGGAAAFLTEQFGAPISAYPDTLFSLSVEHAQEHFMQLAMSGPDQLRQRVAWALHKIWVVSAVEVNNAPAIVTYYRILMNGAFGNYRDLMRAMTLNPAMGRYLNMLNNRSQAVTGVPPNENYPRELLQLFTLGTARLGADGTPMTSGGSPIPSYTETDVKELSRILTGWTFGDGSATTIPTRAGSENYRVPMEAVAAYHDSGPKTFLGVDFPAGQTAVQDLDQAMDVIFSHPNVAPFVSRQLIQQLVTSNPSPGYVAAVAAVFTGSGGELAPVVNAILTHPEAGTSGATPGKLSEPVLYVTSMLRGLNAAVTDHPFMSDKVAAMGQRVFFPPSVFSYFSPSFRVAGTGVPPLTGPEFQSLTSVTALERANFVAKLIGGGFGADVAIDYSPFTSLASDPGALVDACSQIFMGGRMSPEQRNEIVAAVMVTPASNALERTRTALYLTLVAAQAQVDR